MLKGHQGAVNDIAIEVLGDQRTLIASCGRDRTVQLYSKENSTLSLLQSIDQHSSSVNSVRFVDDGRLLLSSSSDRTVVVNSLAESEVSVAYIPARIITLKQSPLSILSSKEEPGVLLVTTMDKQLHRFALKTGRLILSTRLMEDNTPVLLSSIIALTVSCDHMYLRVIIGVSADKSIRIHDAETGKTLLKDYGHSGGVSDVVMVEDDTSTGNSNYVIVSTGLEGTVMFWRLTFSRFPNDQTPLNSHLSEVSSLSQPLRKVLSKSTLAEFSRTLGKFDTSSLPTTPTRNQSPTRPRKRPSKYSLMSGSAKVTTSTVSGPNRSSSPPSPAIPLFERQRPKLNNRNRAHSAEDFNNASLSADQLSKSLRSYRKRLATSDDILGPKTVKELETELGLTMKAIEEKSQRCSSSSFKNFGDLLDQYSDKLAQMVEEKVTLEIAKQKNRNTTGKEV